MSAFAKLESQWKAFKRDEPGHRFEHQHARMKTSGRGFLVGTSIVGALLVAGGVVLLFVPGPGLLLIVFGIALLSGLSERLARGMDRIEPVVRRWARRAKLAWKRASVPVKVMLVALVVAGAGAAAYGAYRLWFA